MQKAFDWVNRDFLWYKLLVHNITGKIYWAVRSIYNYNEFCVKVNTLLSEWFKVSVGVRQGDNLSPTLFGIFINDLAIEIKNMGLGVLCGTTKVSILIYADDIALIAENEKDLQKMLTKLEEWCTKWQLLLNANKSKIVHFRKKNKQKSNFEFYVGISKLQVVSAYKYLGITLNEFLDYQVCALELAEAGGRALGGIISKFKTFKNIGFNTFTKLYHTGVVPINEYASGIWVFRNFRQAEKVQNRAVRYFLGVNSKTPIDFLNGETGWSRPKYRIYLNIFRFYNCLMNMNNDRLTYKIFEYDLQNISTDNWSGELEKILDDLNMQESLLSGQIVDLKAAEEKFNITSDLEWQDSLGWKSKLRIYTKYKLHMECENYLTLNISKYERSMLAKLRSGTLPLYIEKGRYEGKKLERRTCPICKTNEVEDEIHFVINCNGYTTKRTYFLSYL